MFTASSIHFLLWRRLSREQLINPINTLATIAPNEHICQPGQYCTMQGSFWIRPLMPYFPPISLHRTFQNYESWRHSRCQHFKNILFFLCFLKRTLILTEIIKCASCVCMPQGFDASSYGQFVVPRWLFFLFFIELGESTELDSDTPNSNMSICQLLEFIQYKCPLLTKWNNPQRFSWL